MIRTTNDAHIDTWILNVIKIFTERLTRGNMLKFAKNWIFSAKKCKFLKYSTDTEQT